MQTELAGTEPLDTKQLLAVLMAVKKGDFSARMSIDQTGVSGKIYDALNDVIELNEKLCGELARISTSDGKEGRARQRVSLGGASGGGGAGGGSGQTAIVGLGGATPPEGRGG